MPNRLYQLDKDEDDDDDEKIAYKQISFNILRVEPTKALKLKLIDQP